MEQCKKDIVGIGIGPSNLSLAALSHPIGSLSSIFFDKQKNFEWHKGMQLPSAKLQVSYLKDLVTLVDPGNPFSFLSFLSSQKRLYQFINANFQQISRAEFTQYYQWACEALASNLMFNNEVKNISLSGNQLLVQTDNKNILTRSVVLGNGLSPYLPEFAKNKICETLHHSSVFMDICQNYKNKKIAIIGGGQSSAEIVLHLLSYTEKLPKSLTWITRRDNFLPLDDSPFVNELFTPEYSNYFYTLPQEMRDVLVKKQKLFSDGISTTTLEEIYRRIYELNFINGNKNICQLIPETEVTDISKNHSNWCVHTKNFYNKTDLLLDADIVILCTGYRYELPLFLGRLSSKIHRDNYGNLKINEDFSLDWDGPKNCNIYVQNGALHSRGISDPNLSLIPWRSALILNSITKRKVYDVENYKSFFDWSNAAKHRTLISTPNSEARLKEAG